MTDSIAENYKSTIKTRNNGGSAKPSRRDIWPPVPKLEAKHVKDCKIIVDRYEMLKYIPTNGVCAELGSLWGEYASKILEITKPKKLHLVNINQKSIDILNTKFKNDGRVQVTNDYTTNFLNKFEDGHFDWIYIDADHSYEAVKNDLEISRRKIKDNGLISLNDYIFFAPSDFKKYGVIEAVNKFCIENDFEIIYLALHGRSYNDVTIKKIR